MRGIGLKIAICGDGQCGKDTVSEIMSEMFGLRYSLSTSQAAAEVVYDEWGRNIYDSPGQCFNDRRNHREVWRDIILEHNGPCGTALYAEMSDENDIFNGIRDRSELSNCIESGIVDFAVWVHRDGNPKDPSNGIKPSDCQYSIRNNGTIEDLRESVRNTYLRMELDYNAKEEQDAFSS